MQTTEPAKTTPSVQAKVTREEPFFAPSDRQEAGRKAFFGGSDAVSNGFFKPRPAVQTKLTIGAPGDKYEQEADRMAERMVSQPAVQRQELPEEEDKINRKPLAAEITPFVQRQAKEKKEPEPLQRKALNEEPEEDLQRQTKEPEEEPPVQAKAEPGSTSAPANLQSRLDTTRGSGNPLPADTRSQMENAFGADFGSVRVHTGSDAAGLSKDLNAQAFTHGSDVYFNEGKYRPETTEGRRLLGHELVHVLQQGSMIRTFPKNEDDDDYEITRMSITENYAKLLSEKQIQNRINILVDTIKNISTKEQKYKVLKTNLFLLQKEQAKRYPSITEKIKTYQPVKSQSNEMKAKQLRQKFSNGIMVVMSIPGAFPNLESARLAERNSFSSYAWERSWGIIYRDRKNDLDVQELWNEYQIEKSELFNFDTKIEIITESSIEIEEAEKLANLIITHNKLNEDDTKNKNISASVRRKNLSSRKKEEAQLRKEIKKAQNKRKKDAKKLRNRRRMVKDLPKDFKIASQKQKIKIGTILFNEEKPKIKNYIWEFQHEQLVKIELINNATFQWEASRYADEHDAVALSNETEEPKLIIGKHVTYNTPMDIPRYAISIHDAVLDLLKIYPSNDKENSDEKIAKIRFLALMSHGAPGWMGGLHGAKGTSFRKANVHELISSMSHVLASDIRLRLFACSTSQDVKKQPPGGEGSIADSFRDELKREGKDAVVMGHTKSGRAVGNPNLRIFSGSAEGGRTFILNKANLDLVVPDSFINSEIDRLNLDRNNQRLIKIQTSRMRQQMADFFSAKSWLFPSITNELATWEDLGRDFQQFWKQNILPDSKIARIIRGRKNAPRHIKTK